MRRRQNRRRASAQLNHWLILGIFVVLVLAIFGVFLAVFLSTRPGSAPIASAEPATLAVMNTVAITLTPLPQLSPTPPSPTPQIYIVKPGDTLYSIALEFGVTIDDLKTTNALPSDLIFPDQQLFIPAGQSAITAPATAPVGTLAAGTAPERYQVASGDTLEGIAASYNLAVNDLRAANAMIGDTLIPGQFIAIPAESPVALPAWEFSITEGDFSQGYPLSLDTGRFTLHYQPGTFPSQDPEALAQLELNGLNFLESFTGLHLEGHYDVYVAGSNFGPPNRALRGITFSSYFKTFFLHDGTGNADDQQYISTHELTHLFLWNTVGSPSSIMLSEGTAVYTGMEKINGSEHMPIETFCAAYLQAGALPSVSGSLSFLGHTLDLQNYYASGCFVKFLVETYGIDSLKLVYHSGDYVAVYGTSLSGLESEWRIHLAAVAVPAGLDPAELVGAVGDLEDSYGTFFSRFSGSPTQREAYRILDQARIALLQGRLNDMHELLNAAEAIH